jgi:hypothetical protein
VQQCTLMSDRSRQFPHSSPVEPVRASAEGNGRSIVSGEPLAWRQRYASWMTCARRSARDWVLLVIIIAVLGISEYDIKGRKMYITEDMLEKIKFPHGDSTVPSWAVPLYSLALPPLIITAHAKWLDKPACLSHDAVIASTFSTGVSAVATNFFKVTVRNTPQGCKFQLCSMRIAHFGPVVWRVLQVLAWIVLSWTHTCLALSC